MSETLRNRAEFPATHWTLIGAVSGPDREAALSRLYKIYWPPLCAQAVRFGVPRDEVEDFTQELFMSLVGSGAMERAQAARGRFRSYLLGALRNQLSHHRAHALAAKRGSGQTFAAPDPGALATEPAATAMDARDFDGEWAQALLGEALRRFRHEAEHSGESRASFAVLGDAVLGREDLSCEEAARRLGITVAAVKSRTFRLRQRFHEIVREEVRRTVSSETECDEELRYLCSVLERVDATPAAPVPG